MKVELTLWSGGEVVKHFSAVEEGLWFLDRDKLTIYAKRPLEAGNKLFEWNGDVSVQYLHEVDLGDF